jgi:valyl-tRNA synthetase
VPDDRRKALEETTRYDPAKVEQRIFDQWLDAGYFHPPAEGAPDDNYSVAIPPPNVTGALHMGHALNGSIQDALVRMQRMRGRNTLWILGTDHAGIATQAVVEKELREEGISRQELGREAFLERVWAWKERYGSRIVDQYKRLGASLDYKRERFTLDDGYVKAVYRVFVKLFEKGYIYRDNYIVNWDPGSRSAISDLEVENREVTDAMYEIDYPLDEVDGTVTVATVRPETMLADTAVAVNPNDERYKSLLGHHAVLPLVGRRLPIIADEYIDPEFGTGALKVTPGHDTNDFEIGRRHGLEEVTVIGEDGRMTEAAGEQFAGLNIEEAQTAVVEALREQGLIRAEHPHQHSVPFSHRSGARIEPLISLQWFCRMDELAKPAIEVVKADDVRIVPGQWKRVYLDWMAEIRPWCISRQLWWGHRLPVWYCDPCEETYVAETPPERCGACGGELRQEEDVLDTWFSSALWPFATLGWPDDTPELRAFYPTSFLTTAREIIFLWVARMIMMGLEFPARIPFHDVYVHSVIQARDGRRMSKSLGTGIDPVEEIDVHGADALRFGLLAMSSTQDVRYSDAKVQQGRDLANKLWNASRLILLNSRLEQNQSPTNARQEQAPAGVAAGTGVGPAPNPSRSEDRWILSRLQRAVAQVSADLEEYDFAHAALEAYRFFWSELCDWYLEIAKPRLYDGEPEVASTLLLVLEQTLALIHPIMPFVTEEAWSHLPHHADDGPFLMVSSWPTAQEASAAQALVQPSEAATVDRLIELIGGIRTARLDAGMEAARWLPGSISVGEPDAQVLADLRRSIERLARLRPLQLIAPGSEDEAGVAARTEGILVVLGADLEAHISTDGAGTATDRARLERELAEAEAALDRAEARLADAGFTSRAPADVVAGSRSRAAELRERIALLRARMG